MNKVFLIGRLTKEPELRHSKSGKPMANFNLAVNRMYLNQEGKQETDFLNINVWGAKAENCGKYLHKGSQVAVEGSIQVNIYEKEGKKVYSTEINASNVQFLDSKPKTETQKENNPFEEFANEIEEEYPF